MRSNVVKTVTWILATVTGILTLVGSTDLVDEIVAFWFILGVVATATAFGYSVQALRGTLEYAYFKIAAWYTIASMNFIIAVWLVVQ